jgi:peptide/nickel transport system permease protein
MTAAVRVIPGVGGNGNARWHARVASWKRTWYFFRRNTLAMIGLGILILFGVAFVYGVTYNAPSDHMQLYCSTNGPPPGLCSSGYPTVCTYPVGTASPGPGCYQTPSNFNNFIAPTFNPATFSLGPLPLGSLVAPSAGGTAIDQGNFYNLYDGLVKGTVWSITIAAAIVVTGAVSGLLLGAISGYYGGAVDEVLMRLTDIFLSIPQILLVIVIVITGKEMGVTGFNASLWLVTGAFIVTWWPLYTRLVRGQSLVVREQKYVEAARASGAGHGKILRRHVIPNSMFPVFIQMSLDVGAVPLLLAAIAYLGFIIFPAQLIPEWGSIAAASTEVIPGLFQYCALPGVSVCAIPWWQVLFPGLALFLFAISVNLLADGLRDALDPRLRR